MAQFIKMIHSPVSIHCRSKLFSLSQVRTFKMKLTEELIQEGEAKRRAAEEEAKRHLPEKASHTKESSLIMGRVSSERYNKVVKIGVPKHRLNELLLLYLSEQDNVYAYDELDECKAGDWVLLRRQKEPVDEGVEHKVERIVYHYGKFIDPITNRRSMGFYFEDDYERLEKIKLDL